VAHDVGGDLEGARIERTRRIGQDFAELVADLRTRGPTRRAPVGLGDLQQRFDFALDAFGHRGSTLCDAASLRQAIAPEPQTLNRFANNSYLHV